MTANTRKTSGKKKPATKAASTRKTASASKATRRGKETSKSKSKLATTRKAASTTKPASTRKAATKKSAGKIDLAKQHAQDYAAKPAPRTLTPSRGLYLAIEGRGEPGQATFQEAIGGLYAVAYGVKFARKKRGAGPDFGITKLEAQYWGPSKNSDFSTLPKSEWRWKLFIRIPDFIEEREVGAAIDDAVAKERAAAARVRIETLDEGTCVQALHVGPYETIIETLRALESHAKSEGLRFAGLYHEVYVTDPRRTAPAKLRTIIRIPARS